MISCDEAVNRLWAYLDNTLDEVDRVLLEEHLGLCRRCCGELEFAHELRRLLTRSARADIPVDVLARLKQTLEELDQ
jgi:mycothiol system anti-sigma-R factor